MGYTKSGARELRKKARAALEAVTGDLSRAVERTHGVSGLDKAGKVARLTEARDLAGRVRDAASSAYDALSEAVTRAEGVQESPATTAAASSGNTDAKAKAMAAIQALAEAIQAL